MRAQKFILINEELYKRSFTQPLLKCVRPREADYILREIYEGICGSHIGAWTLYQKALRHGYYWSTMVFDAEQLVKKCERCQWVSNLIHVPNAPSSNGGLIFWFTDRTVKEWCQELGIKQHFTSVTRPQANGHIELANRTMLNGLKARVDKANGIWVDELPSILWFYRTTRRGSTGETPFSLCYGSEALIPVEIEIPTFRVEHFDPESNEQGLRKTWI
ncbi:uncharacterized protein LOC127796906 [Diospyros lotus]|uniref:uncharacterized protein LOC127796906 n=1 Tax=Diospyros lotus TaxID=55363 RepID=UPI00225334D8|nr:uncharacterized protein LOC127796906 [Diospyros lotus]